MKNKHDLHQKVLQPVALPSGQVMSNGLVKVAMYEHMATLFGGLPNAHHLALYDLWSQGGWGMILTGNVQVSQDQLTLGKDMVVPEMITSDTLDSYKALARAMRPVSERKSSKHRDDVSTPHTLILMQLSHTGRQSPNLIGGRSLFVPPIAPSALGVGRNASNWFARLMHRVLFPTPRAMSMQDIDNVVNRFVLGTNLAHDAGFDGIELHASHGYLLAQFISPKTNIRDDAYGANHAPLHLLQRIATSIRAVLPRPFVLGIKLNSSDYVRAGSVHDPHVEEEAEDRAVAHVAEIARWDMVDFIEVSGGDYENPVFLPSSGQAFFARFARKARSAIHELTSSGRPLVLLTGGMRSPSIFQDALTQGHADLVGIGRGSVVAPNLPLLLKESYARQQIGTLDGDGDNSNLDRDFLFKLPTLSHTKTPLIRAVIYVLRSLGILPLPNIIGAGTAMSWYIVAMRAISRDQKVNYKMGGLRAVVQVWFPELQVLAVLFSSCLACYICGLIFVF